MTELRPSSVLVCVRRTSENSEVSKRFSNARIPRRSEIGIAVIFFYFVGLKGPEQNNDFAFVLSMDVQIQRFFSDDRKRRPSYYL